MQNLLISAILKKQVVALTYHHYTRTVEPHCFGEDEHGQQKLRCWQIDGGSESGERHGWKILNVNEIQSATLGGTAFPNAQPGYKRGDKAMRRIYAQL